MSFAINISSQVTRTAYRRFTTALLNRIWDTAENGLPTREYANKIQTELLTPHNFKILNIIPDRFNSWPVEGPSTEISFNESRKCIGNGEEKTKTILGIKDSVGGQNAVADFNHPILGSCSVKDMTNDSCTLGTEGRGRMHKILNVVRLVIFWANKYKDDDLFVQEIYTQLNKKHGSSRTTILNGLDNIELSGTNLKKLTKIINNIIENAEKYRRTLPTPDLKQMKGNLSAKGVSTASCVTKADIQKLWREHCIGHCSSGSGVPSPWQNDFLEEI